MIKPTSHWDWENCYEEIQIEWCEFSRKEQEERWRSQSQRMQVI